MQRIRIGIVGCGEVVQIIHLPALAMLTDRIEVVALCDVSRAVVDAVGTRFGIARRCTDAGELLRLPDIDAVLVATPHALHAETAAAVIRSGRRVLLEKPAAMGLRELDGLVQLADGAGVTVQVGFMRRYSPAFLEAKAMLPDLGEIRLARVRDLIGQNAIFIGRTATVARPTDVSDADRERLLARQRAAVAAAIGDVPDDVATAYVLMLGLASHDTSAMRELIGMPRRVLAAAQRHGGRVMTASLDYGGFVCQLEIGVDRIPRFDCAIEVMGMTRALEVTWQTPYIRNLPLTLTVTEGRPDDVEVSRTTRHFLADCFALEWRAFHESLTGGPPPKTSLADAREDLVLFEQMIAAMRR